MTSGRLKSTIVTQRHVASWRAATLTHPLFPLTWNKNWHNRSPHRISPSSTLTFWADLSDSAQNSIPTRAMLFGLCVQFCPVMYRIVIFWSVLHRFLGTFCSEHSSFWSVLLGTSPLCISVDHSAHSAQNCRLLVCSPWVPRCILRRIVDYWFVLLWTSPSHISVNPSVHFVQNSGLLVCSPRVPRRILHRTVVFFALRLSAHLLCKACVSARALCTTFVQLVFSISKLFTATNLTESIIHLQISSQGDWRISDFAVLLLFRFMGRAKKVCPCVCVCLFVSSSPKLSLFPNPIPPQRKRTTRLD